MIQHERSKILLLVVATGVLIAPHPREVCAQSLGASSARPATQIIETELTQEQIFDPRERVAGSEQGRGSFKEPATFSEDEKQLIRMNQSLKNLIEENKSLFKQREELQSDIEALRGERVVQETRLRALANERAELLKRSQEITDIKASYEKKIEDLTKELGHAREDQLPVAARDARFMEAADHSQQTDAPSLAQGFSPRLTGMTDEFSALMEENAVLRKDAIKLHYNLANLFFEQGKYALAAAEYRRVISLMPQDAATHYNLALVSAEYLKDDKSAIKHYQRYIALDPEASDVAFVKNQILKLQLRLRNQTQSYIDKDTGDFDLPHK